MNWAWAAWIAAAWLLLIVLPTLWRARRRRRRRERCGKPQISEGPTFSGDSEALDEMDPPAWVPCLFEECEEFWCTIHRAHVCDCQCPLPEQWESDPYALGSGIFRDKNDGRRSHL